MDVPAQSSSDIVYQMVGLNLWFWNQGCHAQWLPERKKEHTHLPPMWEPAHLSSELDSNPRAYVQSHPVARTHGSIIGV